MFHRLCFFALLLLALPPFTRAQQPFRALRDLPYVTGGSAKQRLDLYLPSEAKSTPVPLMVYVHGGGWQAGSKNDCPVRPQGFAIASIEYRFSQDAPFPAQIEDCKAAIRWLRAHAAEHGIDAHRIGAWGASAGGHLVALLGTTGEIRDFDKGENLDQSSAVQCVIDWFGPADFLHYGEIPADKLLAGNNAVARLLGGPVPERLGLARKASPITYVSKTAAPFLILQGDKDEIVPLQQSQELNAALLKAGVESTLIVVPGAGHGGPGFSSPENLQRMLAFESKYLHLPPP